jgi:hypothetical protein
LAETLTGIAADFFPSAERAVITALPEERPRTTPWEETEATFALFVLHTTVLFVAFAGETTALVLAEAPTRSDIDFGERTIFDTGTTGATTFTVHVALAPPPSAA